MLWHLLNLIRGRRYFAYTDHDESVYILGYIDRTGHITIEEIVPT